jgi:GNAT superfamily N-acetyltransferase
MLTYSRTTAGDAAVIARLYKRYLNDGDNVAVWMEEGFHKPGFCGVKCLDDDELVGVMSARPGVDFTCGHHELVREIETKWKDCTIYTADVGIVLPSHRRRGIAKTLAAWLRECLIEIGCTHVVTELWMRGREDTGDEHRSQILSLFLKCWGEMYNLGKFPDFYSELGKYGMTCPYCGGEDCVCGATIGVFALRGRS